MLAGIRALKTNPKNKEEDPIIKHNTFSSKLNGTVFTASPPNRARDIWITKVAMRIKINRGLLKKFLKTLISCFSSFLALISLNSCKNTKTLKKIA